MMMMMFTRKKSDCKNQIFQNKPIEMDEEMSNHIEIIFANLLDAIPLISNTDNEFNPAILRLYERNAAFFQEIIDDFIQHPEESNITE